jgi:hypothetical protein
MEMPPLMKLVLARNRAMKVDKLKETDFLLSTEKIYEGDVRFSDKVEPSLLSNFIDAEFATYKGNFFNSQFQKLKKDHKSLAFLQ